jgi:hypothetical protein
MMKRILRSQLQPQPDGTYHDTIALSAKINPKIQAHCSRSRIDGRRLAIHTDWSGIELISAII